MSETERTVLAEHRIEAVAGRGVAYLRVSSARSGYAIVPRRTTGVTARALRVRRRSCAPRPDPLALGPARAGLAARLAPAGDAAVAARLHW